MHKEIRNTLAWIVFATFLMFTAVWQAQVAAQRDLEARRQTLPPPAQTKRAIRPAPQVFTGDVAQDYIARCEKGLTDQEIGWILEDLHNAGLDRDPIDYVVDYHLHEDRQFPLFRAAQHRWYHETLVDGLRLSPEQSAQAATKLSELFAEAKEKFLRAITSDKLSVEPYGDIAIALLWLDGTHRSSPWNLCKLTPEQEKITWKHLYEIVDSRKDLGFENRPPFPDNREQAATTGSPLFLRSGPVEPESNKTENLPRYWSANRIFPLLPQQFPAFADPNAFDQPSKDSSDPILEHIRRLHPAQFKTLLLLDPNFAAEIQRALETEPR